MPSTRGRLVALLLSAPLTALGTAHAQSTELIEAARAVQSELVEMVTDNPMLAESGPMAFQRFSEAMAAVGGAEESALHGLYLQTLYGKPIVDFLLRLAQHPTVAKGTIIDRDEAFSRVVRDVVVEAGLLGFDVMVLMGEVPDPAEDGATNEDKVLLRVSPELEDGAQPVAAFHAHLDVAGISEETHWVFPPYPPAVISCDRDLRFPVTAHQVREVLATNPELGGTLRSLQKSCELRTESTFESGQLFENWESLIPEGPLLYGRGVAGKASVALLLYSMRAIADVQLGGNAVLYISLGQEDPSRWKATAEVLKAPDTRLPLANFVADQGGILTEESAIGELVVTFEDHKKPRKPKADTFVVVDFHTRDGEGVENAANRVPASATALLQSGSWLRAPEPEGLEHALAVVRASAEEYESRHRQEHGPIDGDLIRISDADEDGIITIRVQGIAASTRDSDRAGHNAAKDLACFLNTLDLSPNLFSRATRFLEKALGSHGTEAEALGLKAGSEVCGRPPVANLSRFAARLDGDDTTIELLVDVRYPASISREKLERTLRNGMAKITTAGCEVTDRHGIGGGYAHGDELEQLMNEVKRVGLQAHGVAAQPDCSFGATLARMLNTPDDREIGRYALAVGPWPRTRVGAEELGSRGVNENIRTDMLMRGGVFYTRFLSEVVRGVIDLGEE